MEKVLSLPYSDDAAFLRARSVGYTVAVTDGGFVDDIWSAFCEERAWMDEVAYRRAGEDCPRDARGHAIYDFETPVVSWGSSVGLGFSCLVLLREESD
jgi:hypothetical protein